MDGPSIWDTNSQGVIPRAIEKLFLLISQSDADIQFQITVSYFEIYCEKLRDLLNPQLHDLKIRETKNDGFIVQDVTEAMCTDAESILRVIEMGKANRASAPTLMNADSSRSHSILSINVSQKHQATGRNRRGRLFLVDLAGSEKVSKTGAIGTRLEEAKNINSSLTTLGMPSIRFLKLRCGVMRAAFL
jgi:kinesin family member 5